MIFDYFIQPSLYSMPLSSESYYDFIVAGAGAAGLSLVWNLVNNPSFSDQKILLIDRDFSHTNTKTWCFWNQEYIPLPDLIHKSWSGIHVATHTTNSIKPLAQTSYMCIRSGDWSRGMMQELSKHPAITVLQDEVLHLEEQDDGVILHTSTGKWHGGFALQSVRQQPAPTPALYALKQHFLGLEIHAKRPVFNPDAMTLMDFRVNQNNATAFMYVLPFSATHAMVEYTLFSDSILKDDIYHSEITRYLHVQYGLQPDDYEIIGTERGCIPMEIIPPQRTNIKRVLPIGAVSAITKPSTGYAFTRILKQSKGLAEWLLNPVGTPPEFVSPARFRFYDLLLMSILTKDSLQSSLIFGALFSNNSMDTIFRFLDESTGLTEEGRIFWRLPWKPFLKALAQNFTALLSGKI
jgi:lycopene beta-cyclase